MSASAIADALITMLSAASAFGTGGAANHYGVLESTAGSCCVVSWRGVGAEPDQFGNPPAFARTWTMLLDCYCRDTGNDYAVIRRTLTLIDTVMTTLEGDDTIQGQAQQITAIRGERTVDSVFSIEGRDYLRMPIEVDIVEYHNG